MAADPTPPGPKTPYRPDEYWNRRLSKSFDLTGVGHQAFSTDYNDLLYARKVELLEEALHGVSLNGASVFDIGVGTGFFTGWYAERGAKVSGVDITPIAVERARERWGDQFRVADVGAADYEVGPPADLVSMWDVAYHIVDEAAHTRAMHHIAATLKPGALFVMTDWLGVPEDRMIAEHVRARSLATYRQRLGAEGVDLVRSQPLFHLLNRRWFRALDERLAGLYLWVDRRAWWLARRNLSFAVWRKRAS